MELLDAVKSLIKYIREVKEDKTKIDLPTVEKYAEEFFNGNFDSVDAMTGNFTNFQKDMIEVKMNRIKEIIKNDK